MNEGNPLSDHLSAAMTFHQQGQLAKAVAEYHKLLAARPRDDELLSNLGAALNGLGKHDQAIDCYQRAIAINADNWQAHRNLGNALKSIGQTDRALVSFRNAVKVDDANPLLHFSLGTALREIGELEQAAISLGRAIDLRPDYIEAFIALSAIEETSGQSDNARNTLLEGVSIQPYFTESARGTPRETALLFFGLDDCRFRLDEGNNVKMSGGHFLTSELLRPDKFTKHHYLIAKDNLLADAASLPPHDLIVNTIACPDRERRSLETLSRYLKQNPHAPLINHPERILQTTRDGNYQRLQNREGITFPKTLRLKRQGLAQSIQDDELTYPVIIRRVGTQSAVTTRKLQGADECESYLDSTEGDEFYVIQYVECRFREDYYRKLRLFCINGHLYPVVCHIDKVWNVHGSNRKTLMKQNAWMQDEEKRFLKDFTSYIGAENRRRLESLHKLIKLDFYGVDFTLMEDNSILIFELNAAMRHSFDHARALAYLTPSLNNISNAFEAMAIGRSIYR